MLHIWGRLSSINVRKVVWCAQELGLSFQRTEAGGAFGLVNTPEYLALNPNAMVPVIEYADGQQPYALWESNVIGVTCARGMPPVRSIRKTSRPASMPNAGWTGSRPR